MDDRLRGLEARNQSSCSPEDEAALIRQRVRAGDLVQELVDLAAKLGSPSALQVSTCQDERPDGTGVEGYPLLLLARSLGRALAREDKEVGLRVVIAACGLARSGLGARDREILALAESWLLRPSPELRAEARALARACVRRDLLDDLARMIWSPGPLPSKAGFTLSNLADSYGLAAVVESIRAEILPWALGGSDPVRDRLG